MVDLGLCLEPGCDRLATRLVVGAGRCDEHGRAPGARRYVVIDLEGATLDEFRTRSGSPHDRAVNEARRWRAARGTPVDDLSDEEVRKLTITAWMELRLAVNDLGRELLKAPPGRFLLRLTAWLARRLRRG